jgi:hypothetical protein
VITLYHRTQPENAEAILRAGFKDETGTYFTANEHTGVWLYNFPVSPWDLSYLGPTLLMVTLRLSEADIEQFEWVEEFKPHRGWLIPAQMINANSTVEMLTEADELAILNGMCEEIPAELKAEIDAHVEALDRQFREEEGK